MMTTMIGLTLADWSFDRHATTNRNDPVRDELITLVEEYRKVIREGQDGHTKPPPQETHLLVFLIPEQRFMVAYFDGIWWWEDRGTQIEDPYYPRDIARWWHLPEVPA